MNQYKKYMDRQGVSPSLHARLTALAESDGPAPAGRAPHRYRWGILAACCVLAAGLAWAGGVRQPDGAAQAYSMDSAGMQSAQSGAAHQGSSEALEEEMCIRDRAYTGAPEETPYYAIINGENNALYARYRAYSALFSPLMMA